MSNEVEHGLSIRQSDFSAEPDMSYEVFLSHNSEDKPWVETLARNLQRHGVEPFLDLWNLKLGERFIPGLQQGLDESKHGILICTPNTAESYWLQNEYDEMLMRRQRDPDFRMIPVLVRGELPEFFGSRGVNAVDFREQSESAYRIAFRRLLCAVAGDEPGPNEEFAKPLDLPEFESDSKATDADESVSLWTGDVIGKLDQNRVLLLLAQADRLAEQERRSLLARAHKRFGQEAVFRVRVPRHAASESEFFEDVGLQCGFTGTDSLRKFRSAFTEAAGFGEALLIVFGFETCADAWRREFGSCLRTIFDMHDQFHTLITGGRALYQLYRRGEEGSLFSVAKADFCPDPGDMDVRTEWTRRWSEEPQSHIVKSMLNLSGAHPRLLQECWEIVGKGDRLDTEASRGRLADLLVLARAFSASAKSTTERETCAELLQNAVAGRWNNFELPEPLGSLFWNNLLRREGQNLHWRCEAVRDVGQEFVGTTR